jgi:acetyltransferase-like isoleucine patch superfamily enzyme
MRGLRQSPKRKPASRYRYLSRREVATLGFSRIGTDVLIHQLANVVYAENIALGSHIPIDGFCNIVASKSIVIGSYVHVASFCHLSANAELRLEDFAGLSQGVLIYTASDDYSGRSLTNPTVPEEFQSTTRGPVHLGRHVIIGAGTVILPNISIGEGTAVGALSLVNHDLEPWSVYAGVPAVRLGERHRDLLDLEQRLKVK